MYCISMAGFENNFQIHMLRSEQLLVQMANRRWVLKMATALEYNTILVQEGNIDVKRVLLTI